MKNIRKFIRNFLLENVATVEKSTKRSEVDQGIRSEFGDMELVSNSNRGIIYRKSPGVIFKVGLDKDEFDNAVSFIKRPHKNFITYYSAEPWRVFDGEKSYVYTMEEIRELNEKEWDIVDLINNSLGVQDYMLDDSRRYNFMREIKENPEWYENIGTYKEVRAWVINLYNMYKEADRRGLELHDLRAQNLGINKNGVPVHFDMGEG